MTWQITEKGGRILGQVLMLVGMAIALTVFYLMAYDRGRDSVNADCNRRLPEVEAYYAGVYG